MSGFFSGRRCGYRSSCRSSTRRRFGSPWRDHWMPSFKTTSYLSPFGRGWCCLFRMTESPFLSSECELHYDSDRVRCISFQILIFFYIYYYWKWKQECEQYLVKKWSRFEERDVSSGYRCRSGWTAIHLNIFLFLLLTLLKNISKSGPKQVPYSIYSYLYNNAQKAMNAKRVRCPGNNYAFFFLSSW